MSKLVKLKAAMPADEQANGLDSLREELLKTPELVRCAFIWYDVSDVNHKVATNEDVPTIEVRKFVPVGLASEIPEAMKAAVLELDEKRQGKTPLPFDQITATTDGPVD